MSNLLKDFNTNLHKSLQNKIKNIPSDITEVMFERAYNDTKKIIGDTAEQNFKKIMYGIYKAYIIGFIFADLKKVDFN